jgi:hypothetical protein
MKKVFGVLVALCLSFAILTLTPRACSNDPVATQRILEDAGYKDVKLTGWRPYLRGDDVFSTGFEATGPNGRKVSGAVTSGPMKGHTIRFE